MQVKTIINNLILGKPYCNHHGTMKIKGNRQYFCEVKFKDQSLLERMPRQVKNFKFYQQFDDTVSLSCSIDIQMISLSLNLTNFIFIFNNGPRFNSSLYVASYALSCCMTIELTVACLQVEGYVEDVTGNRVASLRGEWNSSLYCKILKPMISEKMQGKGDSLLWKKNEPPADPTRYNVSSFAITLNELTPELQV